MKIQTTEASWRKRGHFIGASSQIAVSICAILAFVVICCLYVSERYRGNPFAWFDGTTAWLSFGIYLFAALLCVYFIIKTHCDLSENAKDLATNFGLEIETERKLSLFGWDPTPRWNEGQVDINALWQRYSCRGQFWNRFLRTFVMTILYLAANLVIFSPMIMIGDLPRPPVTGQLEYRICLILGISAWILLFFLTFFVIDAILLHNGFLQQLTVPQTTFWPEATFKKHNFTHFNRIENKKNLADYFDILLIAQRTEAVGNIIYYPLIILSLIVVTRLKYFANWTWSPIIGVALFLIFCIAFFAAWWLTREARRYRDTVLARLKQRKLDALMFRQGRADEIMNQITAFEPQERAVVLSLLPVLLAEASTDALLEEVQSTHQGAFSYLWEQPAIRALLLSSGGMGLATLLQYLPQ